MSYTVKTISVNGTEQAFIQSFANALTAADSRITCETDIAEQYADMENPPTIIFNINGWYKLKMVRGLELPRAAGFGFYIVYGDNEKLILNNASFSVGHSSTTETTRKYGIRVITSSSWLVFCLSTSNVDITQGFNLSLISVNTESLNLYASSGVQNKFPDLTGSNLIRIDSGYEGETYSMPNRIDYPRNDDNIEIIKNKVLLNAGIAEVDFDGLYDCSTVTQDSIITINNKNYYALSAHTLAPID